MIKPYYSEEGITIYHGDCRITEELMQVFPDIDLLLTDPPYGIGESNEKALSRGKLAKPTDYGHFEWDKETAPQEIIEAYVDSCDKSIVWGGNYFDFGKSPAWLVWDKMNGSNDFADCELAWTNLNQAVRLFKFMWNGMLRDGEQRGVARVHPTQKPVELMRWCLNLVPEAQTIIDPFMGSGTTLRAAKDLGRKAIGIETEEKYCEIAVKRLRQEVLPLEMPSSNTPRTPLPLDLRLENPFGKGS